MVDILFGCHDGLAIEETQSFITRRGIMPKIIEPPKGKKITCRECRAVISYMPAEVKGDYFGSCNYGNDSGDYRRYVKCPACHEYIFLS